MIQLGDKVKDTITGFEGVAIARSEWLNGCVRFELQSAKLSKDGIPVEAQWFDDSQLTVVKLGKSAEKKDVGGPRAAPSRAKDPIY